jgi:hypothetical protein
MGGATELIVYVDRSDIRRGTVDELRDALRGVVAFVEAHEPQLIAYGFYVDEDAHEMTVVAVHPDSASLELHLDVGRSEFAKLGHLITLRDITVYGVITEQVLESLQRKAAALGNGARVRVLGPHAAFARTGGIES